MPEDQVKRLCDLQVKIFEQSLEAQKPPQTIPGHSIHTLMSENRAAEKWLQEIKLMLDRLPCATAETERKSNFEDLRELLINLAEIDKHYLKKENQLFPLLEEKGMAGPTKIRWAIHDDIRKELKGLLSILEQPGYSDTRVQEITEHSLHLI